MPDYGMAAGGPSLGNLGQAAGGGPSQNDFMSLLRLLLQRRRIGSGGYGAGGGYGEGEEEYGGGSGYTAADAIQGGPSWPGWGSGADPFYNPTAEDYQAFIANAYAQLLSQAAGGGQQGQPY